MRITPLCLLVPLIWLGCSKNQDTPPKDGNRHNVSTNGLPFAVTVVETEQSTEWGRLSRLALHYLQATNYDELEKLAEDGRSAEDAWPDGDWRVVPVYVGLELSDSEDDKSWLSREVAIKGWMDARPESVTARIALARHLMSYAWKARGSGFANTVSDDAEKIFEKRLREAAVALGAARGLTQKCPVYWTALMTVARGLGVDRAHFDAICQQAIQAYPDYTPIYVQRGTYLLPRWFGEEGEWERDLAKSADRMGGEKGDILYAQVAWALKNYSEHGNIFDDTKALSWERIDRGWDALEKKSPDSPEAIQAHGHMAGLAGDREKAKACLMKTGGKIALSQWYSKGEFIDYANWALGQ